MKVKLHYGQEFVGLEIPQDNIARIVRPKSFSTPSNQNKTNRQALADAMSPEKTKAFVELAAGKKICVLLPDGTRDLPFEDTAAALSPILTEADFTRFIICTGTHNGQTADNQKIIDIIKKRFSCPNCKFDICVHDCRDDEFVNAGRTKRGTDILYSRKADDFDIYLAVSDVKSHYFAGYSNPIKNLVPGICAYKTAEQNHRLALEENSTFGVHPWHSNRQRTNNPLAMDMAEGVEFILKSKPFFALVMISNDGDICRAKFGAAEQVAAEAFDEFDRMNSFDVAPSDKLIVSPGAYPNDVDLYIAQRALELSKAAVKDGGEILFIAQCRGGIGEPKHIENFYEPMTGNLEQLLQSKDKPYRMYAHKPYKFAQLIKRTNKIWMYSDIEPAKIKKAHLWPASNPQTVVDRWLSDEPNCQITIVDGANKVSICRKI